MIKTLREWWKKNPGFVVSGGVHLIAFLFLVLNINWARAPEETVENVPVEMVTTSDFNQIMNGEKTAKQMDVAQRRVDQVAVLEDHKPAPPIPDSVKDTPPPPSPEKANNDPGQEEKKEEANAPPPAAPPEKPQPVVPPPPVPTPPERPVEKTETPTPPEKPVEKAETPTPPEKPDDVKPPEEAEAIEKKPPPKVEKKVEKPKKEPKREPKKVAKKKPPVPKPRPVEVAEAKDIPDPPRRPDVPEEPSLKKRTLDQVAKLLDTLKPPKEEKKQKSGNEVKETKPTAFSLDKITALLDHDAPQRRASTGQKATRVASLGSPTAHAEKMSPTLMAQIDGWLIDHYRGCWSYFGLGAATDYVPKVHVQLSIDGTLTARPVLINQPSDPNLRSLADSAMRAVNKCNPMPIPPWFKSHYEAWRDRTVRFDPKEMS